jgi:hypothetical protein
MAKAENTQLLLTPHFNRDNCSNCVTMTLLYIIRDNKGYRLTKAASEKYVLRLGILLYSVFINKVTHFKTILLLLKRLVDKISLI